MIHSLDCGLLAVVWFVGATLCRRFSWTLGLVEVAAIGPSLFLFSFSPIFLLFTLVSVHRRMVAVLDEVVNVQVLF